MCSILARRAFGASLNPSALVMSRSRTPIASQVRPISAIPFYGWLVNVFNKFDEQRVADVGPDRACAEWLLKCGACVTWKGAAIPLKDYNALPVGDFRRYKVAKVDATDAGINESGFAYFGGLEELEEVKLKNCVYVSDDSLYFFAGYTRGRKLVSLEVSDNGTVTDKGIILLGKIETLRRLRLENLPGVSDPKTVLEKIKRELPECVVITDWTNGPNDD